MHALKRGLWGLVCVFLGPQRRWPCPTELSMWDGKMCDARQSDVILYWCMLVNTGQWYGHTLASVTVFWNPDTCTNGKQINRSTWCHEQFECVAFVYKFPPLSCAHFQTLIAFVCFSTRGRLLHRQTECVKEMHHQTW